MANTNLKPPPNFAKNEWAWAYTMRKLEDQGLLDADGNPDGRRGYMAANRIYHNVVKKYGAEKPDLPTAAERARNVMGDDLDRAELLDMDIGGWVVSRGILWSANDDRQQLMFMQRAAAAKHSGRPAPSTIIEPLCLWRIQVHTDGVKHEKAIPDSTALWLVRESPDGERFVRDEARLALGYLREMKERIDADYSAHLDGRESHVQVTEPIEPNRGVQVVTSSDMDFGTTLSLISRHIAEMEAALTA